MIPSIKLYYQTAGMVWIVEWIKNPNWKLFMKLETTDLAEGLHSLSYLWVRKKENQNIQRNVKAM